HGPSTVRECHPDRIGRRVAWKPPCLPVERQGVATVGRPLVQDPLPRGPYWEYEARPRGRGNRAQQGELHEGLQCRATSLATWSGGRMRSRRSRRISNRVPYTDGLQPVHERPPSSTRVLPQPILQEESDGPSAELLPAVVCRAPSVSTGVRGNALQVAASQQRRQRRVLLQPPVLGRPSPVAPDAGVGPGLLALPATGPVSHGHWGTCGTCGRRAPHEPTP